MCLHLVGLITIYILPRFIRGDRSNSKKTTNTTDTTTNETNSKSSTNGLNGSKHIVLNTNDAHKKPLENFTNDIQMKKQINCDININGKHIDAVAQKRLNENGTLENKKTDNCNSLNVNNDEYRSDCHKTTDNHLSMKIRERIDSETRNIEEFIDKTVTGIVELKDDLMRVNNGELYLNTSTSQSNQSNGQNSIIDDGLRKRNLTDLTSGKEIENFLRKEINNAVNQVNVLPAVLSNGHGE